MFVVRGEDGTVASARSSVEELDQALVGVDGERSAAGRRMGGPPRAPPTQSS